MRREVTQALTDFGYPQAQFVSYDAPQQRRLYTKRQYYTATVSVGLNVGADDSNEPRSRTVLFAFEKAQHGSDDHEPLLRVHTSFAPSFFMACAYDPSTTFERHDDASLVRTSAADIKFEESTGKLLAWTLRTSDGEAVEIARVVTGVRKTRLDEVEAAMADVPAIDAPLYPVTAYVQFFLDGTLSYLVTNDMLARLGDDQLRIVSAIEIARELTHYGALRPIDMWLKRIHKTGTKNDPFQFRLPPSAATPMNEDLTKSALSLSNYLYERDTWPWTLLRQAAFLRSGQGEYAIPIINATLHQERSGPLAHWLAAELLVRQHPQLAGEIAQRGLRQVDTASFDDDCQQLLPRQREIYMTLLHQFAHLTAQEIQEIADRWPGYAALLNDLRCIDTQATDADVGLALQNELSRHWEATLGEPLSAAPSTARQTLRAENPRQFVRCGCLDYGRRRGSQANRGRRLTEVGLGGPSSGLQPPSPERKKGLAARGHRRARACSASAAGLGTDRILLGNL